ncbi:TetR family transcriptional regulator [Mycolicibacterium neworleansense]|uniref:TetR family transcriptional regulator n=1 Tax=Mycolicibacterium neworleansense TaxID=146018 RepID=A0A0H5SA01_9MYCO|nr:TetR family transcriptional regulator [Mycolicibacterium neworleansense]MCV7360829.1 TetR family transcriptional regulator [Mycolicibacterium neworleansense]CRZ18164.1 TetR family transcriptional regulator [Mycolicibacterium neworleansense]
MRSTTELRDEILAAARAEFARYGLAGARIDRIAKAAHASKERLYAHFGDKETLFREVFAADGAEFFRSVSLRPEDVPEFVGDIFDLACRRPEHLRMITWAQLEGFTLDEPATDGPSPHAQAVAAIAAAQAGGHVDPGWDSTELIVLLFGIGLAWAHLPSREAVTDDPDVIASRRAAAVEAAARVVAHQR